MKYYQTFEDVCSLVERFESCEIKPDDFNHRAHLTVAAFYLLHPDFDLAAAKVRDGLFRFLSHYNLDGYNETITIFWLRVVEDFVKKEKREISVPELVNKTIEFCSDSKLVFQYYSREHLNSKEAKTSWVEPDLKSFNTETNT